MMNWAAAHAIGLVPPVAVEGDTSGLACYRATTFAKCYEAKMGRVQSDAGCDVGRGQRQAAGQRSAAGRCADLSLRELAFPHGLLRAARRTAFRARG